ncbi:hypothetical protein [Rhodococcoides fascians]|uniref:hypothetical protein n=1 Tax=Rhodococcoides fascians TaxID=1828 RepID=UPI000522E909|nr:hypothetical protein [Rhodococcus fascians]
MSTTTNGQIFAPGERASHSTAPVAAARFDRDGEPIGYLHWHELCRRREYRSVASDIVTIDGHRLVVSTYWSGVSADDDRPVGIFATRLIAPEPTPADGWMLRHDNIVDASTRHADIVDELRCGHWPT